MSIVLTVALLLGAATTAFAATETDPAATPETTETAAPAVAGDQPAGETGPATAQPATVPAAPPIVTAPPPAPIPAAAPMRASEPERRADPSATAAPADPIIEMVGVQRISGAAYPEPQTRGIMYGSLWHTFHGLQWPYLPSGKVDRFVIGLSGWGWVDTAYEKFAPWGANPSIEQSRITYWKQQARLLLRATPTYSFQDNVFLQGQVELVGTGDQTISRGDTGGADTDDLWLRVGRWNRWDFQVGRFEGWEVFHLGMGLDFNTFERKGAVGIGESAYNIGYYGLTDNQFRPQGAAGNMAFHYYPLPYLRFELLGMAGSFSGPALATRPVAILDLGWLKVKVGAEWQRIVGQQASDKTEKTSRGLAAAVQIIPNRHFELGVNVAQGTVWSIDGTGKFDPKGSLTRTSVGGFANVSNAQVRHNVMLGVGSVFTQNVDQNDILQNGTVDKYWLYQGYVATQYVFRSQFYVKLVGGYSRGHWLTAGNDPPITFDDEMYSLRLRFSYYF